MKKYILLLFIVVSFNSCKQSVAVDFPQFEEKLVAVSYIEEGEDKYLVYINKTIDPHLDNYWNYIDTSFATAKVMLSIDNVPFQLRRIPKSEYHKYNSSVHNSYGRFFALDKKVENITNVKLTAEYEGMKVESECNILPTPHIKNSVITRMVYDSQKSSGLKVDLEADFPSGKSFYMMRLGVTYFNAYYGKDQFSETARGYFVVNNAMQKKEFVFDNIDFSSTASTNYYTIIFTRIEKAYYDFALASKAQVGETDTFLPVETTEVPSNIRGGYGIFTAMSSDTVKVTLQ